MSYGEIRNETYIRVFQEYFNKYPNPLSDEHKIKLQEKLKEFDQRIEEFKREYREQVFNYIEEEEINSGDLTDKEITTYLVYSLVIADRPRVKTTAITEFEPPKNLERLTSLISEYDRDIGKYRDWRNQLENTFKALRLGDLIIFGRYSETSKKEYTLRGRDYNLGGANAHECRWSTEIMQTVLAIIRTKLRKDALEAFDAEIATINCYFRSNTDGTGLKDVENYSTRNISYLLVAEAWHDTAVAEGRRINPNVTNAIIQKGFRDVFDENFTRDSMQSLNQKEFLAFNFYKNLDWNDDSRMRKQIN
ncbi:11815_t:CDS:2 [Dentiscutata erythropus]|uniref:11815_t:CDS:1 n=1 Tax=Dentiscutata erythropus TaxID=1348616 RepID=A0A9N9CM65_9GLOM|nr:11815_t:CDS:2 [Dentiscutata erythropus]